MTKTRKRKDQKIPKAYLIGKHFVSFADNLEDAIEEFLSWVGPVYLSQWPEIEVAQSNEAILKIMGVTATYKEVPKDLLEKCGVYGGCNW